MEFIKNGDTRHIICKMEIPMTPWSQQQIEDAVIASQELGLKKIHIEGDDFGCGTADDDALAAAGFNVVSTTLSGRKVWEKVV